MSTIKAIDVQVSGFDPGTKYNFIFKNKGGNWPVRVSPLSGIFFPRSVKTYVYFCSNSGECPESDDNVFYNVPANNLSDPGIDLSNKSLYTVLDLEIRDNTSNELLHTHPCIVQCDQCIPQLSLSFNNAQGNLALTNEDGNSKPFTVKCEGLIPNQEYSYVLNGGGGNWPLKITPRSGVILTSSADYTLNGLLTFCPSTGVCPSTDPSIINYQDIENRKYNQDPYSIIDFSLTPNNTFQTKIVGSFAATCSDCIPSIKIASPAFVDVGPNHENNQFSVNITNLVIGEKYNYSFEGIDGNWPVILSPHSGVIVATSDSMNLPVVATFCTATGLCANNTPGVMTYTNTRSSIVSLNAIKKQSRFRISLNQNSSPIVYSNETVAVCSDCLPGLQATLPSSTSLSSEDGNYKDFTLDIDNMVPGVEYQYVFKNIDSNWPAIISPISGSIIRDESGPATYQVPVSITMCETTGLCPNGCANVLTYTPSNSCVNKIVRFRAQITPVGYDLPGTSTNAYVISCDDCIPKPSIVIPAIAVDKNNETLFSVAINGLSPTTEYKYKFVSTDANWPVSVHPISGIITSVENYSLNVKTSFCETTGVCPNGSPNILTYTAGSNNQFNFGSLNKFATIRLELDAVLPSYNDTSTVYSNESVIRCSGCIPPASVVVQKDIVVGENNVALVNISGLNLSKNTEYRYTLLSLDSNWPTTFNPISGVIVNSTECSIPTTISFCASTGICANGSRNVLAYNASSSYSQFTLGLLQKSTKFQVKFDPVNNDLDTIYSNESLVRCGNCIPEPKVTLPDTVIVNGIDPVRFTASASGLLEGVEYKYRFIGTDSNWPTMLNPISGNIISSTKFDLPIQTSFCVATGVCVNGSTNILNYSLANNDQYDIGLLSRFSKAKLELVPNAEGLPTLYSNEMTILCSGCLTTLSAEFKTPKVDNPNKFDDSYFDLNLYGLIPGVKYSYQFEPVNNNWPMMVSPISGIILATGTQQSTRGYYDVCYTTGLCPTGAPDVLSYTYDSVNSNISRQLNIRAKIKALNSRLPEQEALSNILTIRCDSDACLPSLSISGVPPTGEARFGETYKIVPVIKNLIPSVVYNYKYTVIDSNWPSIVSPMSGVIRNVSGYSIPTTIQFCKSTGLCPNGSDTSVFAYDLDSVCQTTNSELKIDKFTNFLLEVTPQIPGLSKVYSNSSLLTMSDNVGGLSIKYQQPSVTVGEGNNVLLGDNGISLGKVSQGVYGLSTLASGLIAGEKYQYSVNYIDSNWPVVISPQSGSFIATNVNKFIYTDVGFCYPSGECAVNTKDAILQYRINSLYKKDKKQFLLLNLSVQQSGCPQSIVYGQDYRIECNNCMNMTPLSVSISGSPVIDLGGCCSGTRLIVANISGALANNRYKYEFLSLSDNITFNIPYSGYATFSNNGSGVIMGIANTNLANYDEGVIRFKLSNDENGTEINDYLGLKCGPDCAT